MTKRHQDSTMSKRFVINRERADTIRGALPACCAATATLITWALRDLSFRVAKG
ncbi:MAG: hypothetical protein U0074_08555 [Kouleothrix sp.]